MEQRPQYRQTPSRPQTAAADAEKPAPISFTPPKNASASGANKFKKFWWLPVLIVVLALAAWLYFGKVSGSQIDGGKYQAVFLNNGQVYFGKLKGFYTDRPYLTDVYYIQADDGQAADGEEAATNTQKLIKLGKEIHGPENKLILNRDAVLFVENLTDDSEVVKVIKSDNKQ